MYRFLLLAFLLLSTGLPGPAAAQSDAPTGLPPRPAPFRFVNDQASLLAPADAKKLESGLRRYADNTGTQVVVVTVPSLGGRDVADYGRALGSAWGVGQRDKNNGVVVLLGAQEHQVTIQPGSGLKGTITPAVSSRIIGQMAPSFKQGNYFAGLRAGLNTLMATAHPGSEPRRSQPSAAPETGVLGAARARLADEPRPPAVVNDPVKAPLSAEPAPSGLGTGTVVLGALLIGGVLWMLLRLFRSRSEAAGASNAAPNFLPNRPTGPVGGYGPGPGQAPGNYGAPYGGAPASGGGMGVGGMLATGAAAAAGAYLGNRMASGHEAPGSGLAPDAGAPQHFDAGPAAGGGVGTGAADGYFSSREASADTAAPDYFSADNEAADNSSSDYFSSDDNSSYDDTASGDNGGGGFDGDSGGSGSW
ncbi:MAG: hypothetical protein NVSMB30_28530 [Hymenobacter sp.]